jgi:inorganic pyrophosphatase
MHPWHDVSLGESAVVRARAVGLLRMVQSGGRDDKILAVHIDDPAVESCRECKQPPPSQLAEIEKFFRDYRALERVEIRTLGFGDAREAMQHLAEGASAYAARMEHGRASA